MRDLPTIARELRRMLRVHSGAFSANLLVGNHHAVIFDFDGQEDGYRTLCALEKLIAELDQRLAAGADGEAWESGALGMSEEHAKEAPQELEDRLKEALAPGGREPNALLRSNEAAALYHFLAHGDDEHKAWLSEALTCYFEGKPRPEPRSRPQPPSAPQDWKPSYVPLGRRDDDEPSPPSGGRPIEDKYNELLYAVAKKFPNESRHETALRYIREREQSASSGPAKSAPSSEQPKEAG